MIFIIHMSSRMILCIYTIALKGFEISLFVSFEDIFRNLGIKECVTYIDNINSRIDESENLPQKEITAHGQ